MVKQLISPNLHVILLHYPLGIFMGGLLIELFSFMWRRSGFRAAGRWMILIGALSGIPAATAGLYALSEVSRAGLDQTEASAPWKEVTAVSPLWRNAEAAEHMTNHVFQQSTATILAVLACVIWMGCSDKWRASLRLPTLALLLVAAGFMAIGAWNGGEAVYRHGVAVRIEQPSLGTTVPAVAPATAPDELHRFQLSQLVPPPLELHVILAGAVIAIAMAALGLSFRAVSQGPGATQVDQIASALGPYESLGTPVDLRGGTEIPGDFVRLRVPAARFWMLAVLLGLLTAAAGYWVLARSLELGKFDPNALWRAVSDRDQAGGSQVTRRLAHAFAGVSIVVLSLILAMVARFAPRAKIAITFFALLLLAIVAAQVWFGVLLLFDTNVGNVTGFN